MSNQLKRIKCSLYLDPINSDSERYAFGVLSNWAQAQKKLVETPSSGQELHDSLHKHTSIYLSGLFLYLLSPTLTEQLSRSLTPDLLSMGTLAQKIEMCGLKLPTEPTVASDGQVNANLNQQIDHLNQSVNSQIDDMREMIQQLLANQPQPVFEQAADVVDHTQQLDELKQLVVVQNQMLRALQGQVTVAGQSRPTQAEEAQLDETIASVRKIKSKGLF